VPKKIDFAIEHQKRVQMLKAGYTDKEIAEACGCSVGTIQRWRFDYGFECNFEKTQAPKKDVLADHKRKFRAMFLG
jgi:uncharacterized protein YjcR